MHISEQSLKFLYVKFDSTVVPVLASQVRCTSLARGYLSPLTFFSVFGLNDSFFSSRDIEKKKKKPLQSVDIIILRLHLFRLSPSVKKRIIQHLAYISSKQFS